MRIESFWPTVVLPLLNFSYSVSYKYMWRNQVIVKMNADKKKYNRYYVFVSATVLVHQ